MSTPHPKAQMADIALLLEGTFPYVSGGVSSWINQIIRAYPQYRFALVFLGSRRSDYAEFRYALPDNVVHFEEHYLYEIFEQTHLEPAARPGNPRGAALVQELIDSFRRGDSRAQSMELFHAVAQQMLPGGCLQLEDFLYSERAWNLLCDM